MAQSRLLAFCPDCLNVRCTCQVSQNLVCAIVGVSFPVPRSESFRARESPTSTTPNPSRRRLTPAIGYTVKALSPSGSTGLDTKTLSESPRFNFRLRPRRRPDNRVRNDKYRMCKKETETVGQYRKQGPLSGATETKTDFLSHPPPPLPPHAVPRTLEYNHVRTSDFHQRRQAKAHKSCVKWLRAARKRNTSEKPTFVFLQNSCLAATVLVVLSHRCSVRQYFRTFRWFWELDGCVSLEQLILVHGSRLAVRKLQTAFEYNDKHSAFFFEQLLRSCSLHQQTACTSSSLPLTITGQCLFATIVEVMFFNSPQASRTLAHTSPPYNLQIAVTQPCLALLISASWVFRAGVQTLTTYLHLH